MATTAAAQDTATQDQERVETARRFLTGGAGEVAAMLALRLALRPSHPTLARQLSRRLAEQLIQGRPMAVTDVDQLWKACKTDEAFSHARRVLRRRLDNAPHIGPPPPGDTSAPEAAHKVREQLALMTSKDPDLAASMRHDWALQILQPDLAQGSAEALGIAGGIYKRRWEADGRVQNLELALQHYRAPVDRLGVAAEQGYPAINAAFVADLLARQTLDAVMRQHWHTLAGTLRELLTKADLGTGYWPLVTLAEAHLGLGTVDQALPLLRDARACQPDPWERDTTARQLARLGDVLGLQADARQAVAALVSSGPDDPTGDAWVESVLVGKVGLALSGGGFRASLYHLGVLARLAESDLLRHVQVISGVSGGSMAAAAYYLRLRQLLQANPAPQRSDYITLVEQLIDDFRQGTNANLRGQLFTSLRTCRAVVEGDDDVFAAGTARAIHAALYSRTEAQDLQMADLTICPAGAPKDFHPKYHNAARRDKVPALVLNATTLNTGHAWQFTPTSMGESPASIVRGADPLPRLRRAYYRNAAGDVVRPVSLAQAVAASACVPGMFAPLNLPGLYDGQTVSLVDGGVHDNQGALALLQDDCTVLLVSDASGQLGLEAQPGGGHLGPVLRSFSIFQERTRQSGFQRLADAQASGRLAGLACVNLKQDLDAPPLDWTGCDDPGGDADGPPNAAWAGEHTRAGVWKPHQTLLAGIRTDLDMFSDIEAAALMASGALAMGAQVDALAAQVPALGAPHQPHAWFFQPLARRLAGPDAVLQTHLEAGATMFLRLALVDTLARRLVIGLAVLLVLALVVVLWRTWHIELSVGWLVLALGVPLVWLLLAQFKPGWSWLQLVLDPVGLAKSRGGRLLAALGLWLAARAVVPWVTRRFLAAGRLDQLDPPGRTD